MTEKKPRDNQPRKPRIPTEERLVRQALHYLDRYASSTQNLRGVLERKVMRAAHAHERDPAEFAEMIDAVVAKCQRSGVVNDLTYAEIKLTSLRRKGQSERKIAAYLGAHGVDRDTIGKVLESDETDEIAAARTYARRRRLGPFRTSGNREEKRQRDLAALCRAGYPYGLARQVIDEELGDVADDDMGEAED
ncbi:regulatory protein RecX [Roseibium sp. CAU 1637]|uniref:Regulatory protein RecX n=1 Tax=Roseibium limicola TaxID=2816037 RepID=A0A939EKQ7_9HYPH|nr:regulatory protein RecX [Roseibium limicola]MBO0344455.1 regulatory protein RecX [Roseibium limicola]